MNRITIDIGSFVEEKIDYDLSGKSNVGHTHTSSEITDISSVLNEAINEDLDLLLLTLSERINEI